MKKLILLSLIFLSLNISFAQVDRPNNPEMRTRMLEKLETQRVAFITNRLDLTTEEAAKFWPLYNEYSKKRFELKKAKRQDRNEASEESIEDQFDQEEQILNLKKNYYEKFKTALPVSKIAKLDDVEKDFKIEVIKVLRQRRQERRR
ncbi:MAG: hypothetical protein ABIO44_13675 [Saprospiraceae bacterium]